MPQGGSQWRREQKHPGCSQCKRTASWAKTAAIAEGLDSASYTHGEHSATVIRPVRYMDTQRGRRAIGQQRWRRDSTHGTECRRCNEAAANAKTNAILNNAESAEYRDGEHAATMARPGKR